MIDFARENSYSTPISNSSLLPILLLSLLQQKNAPSILQTPDTLLPEYDVIIVGAGSAGSTLAGRLSELPYVNVLLIEAGGAPPLMTEIPGIGMSMLSTDVDWNYTTTPQKNTGRLITNRQIPIPLGKAFGGGSTLNGLMTVRGNKEDYDDWEKLGATGWGYEDVLPYFKKLENQTDPELLKNDCHGEDGPLTIESARYLSIIKKKLLEATEELGYKVVDSNCPGQTGIYDFQANTRNGQRCSTAKAYLVPAETRPNLHILPNAFTYKVVLENDKATGIMFEYDGNKYVVNATKEVIISAGTINTAKLLMLSGIGPKDELEKFNIPVIKDLPVGNNFHDHCFTITSFELDSKVLTTAEKFSDPEVMQTYIGNRTGILSSPWLMYLTSFLTDAGNPNNVNENDRPKFQTFFIETYPGFYGAQGLDPSAKEKIFSGYKNKPSYYCKNYVLQPKSRGTVKLASSNPHDTPLIDPNYLDDQEDVQNSIEAMKFCRKISSSKQMQEIGSKPIDSYPGCEQFLENETMDDFLECQLRSEITTGYHPVGTAKMGNPEDPTTVVDPLLRVKGISGLRVVDGSVMPTITSGNTNIPIIMIAEKASDIIKHSLKCEEKF